MHEDYYRRRAASYERIYARPERQADLRALEAWLPGEFAGRQVLEIACGTGWWTLHGARAAAGWLATDLVPETMAIAQAKPMPRCVRFATLDAHSLAGVDDAAFDGAFAAHWWSQLARDAVAGWIERLHAPLAPGARVVFLDNLYIAGSSTPIARTDAAGNTYQQRTLDDGSHHEVLKNFPTETEARAALGGRAQDVRWAEHGHYWTLAYTLAD